MPVMDGYQAARALRELKEAEHQCLQGTKIIALSATTEAQFRKHGGDDFDMFSKAQLVITLVEKPVHIEALRTVLTQDI